jgi:hypothetical protein
MPVIGTTFVRGFGRGRRFVDLELF